MLEQLAGPFPLTIEGGPNSFAFTPIWHDAVGLLGVIQTADSGYHQCVCQIDGAAYIRTQHYVSPHTHNLETGGLAVSKVDGLQVWFYPTVDMLTFQPSGQYLDASGFFADVTGQWTVLPDRRIYSATGVVWVWPFGAEERSVEYTLPGPGEFGDATITPGREFGKVFIGYPSGRIYEYDWQAQELAAPIRYIAPCVWSFFSPMLGVFVSVHVEDGAHALRVWSDEVRADSIAQPSAVGDVVRGRICEFLTAVTGDEAEACVDRVVAWGATVGQVLDERTATDAAGEARTRILLPVDLEDELLTVTAELVG